MKSRVSEMKTGAIFVNPNGIKSLFTSLPDYDPTKPALGVSFLSSAG